MTLLAVVILAVTKEQTSNVRIFEGIRVSEKIIFFTALSPNQLQLPIFPVNVTYHSGKQGQKRRQRRKGRQGQRASWWFKWLFVDLEVISGGRRQHCNTTTCCFASGTRDPATCNLTLLRPYPERSRRRHAKRARRPSLLRCVDGWRRSRDPCLGTQDQIPRALPAIRPEDLLHPPPPAATLCPGHRPLANLKP